MINNTINNYEKSEGELLEIFPYCYDDRFLDVNGIRNPYNDLKLYGSRRKVKVNGKYVIVDYLYNLDGKLVDKKVIEDVRHLNNSIEVPFKIAVSIIGTFVLGILSVAIIFS